MRPSAPVPRELTKHPGDMVNPSSETVETRLVALIHQRLHVDARPESPLSSLGVDSLRLADFVSDLERSFGFSADQDIFDVETVGELAHYIHERMA